MATRRMDWLLVMSTHIIYPDECRMVSKIAVGMTVPSYVGMVGWDCQCGVNAWRLIRARDESVSRMDSPIPRRREAGTWIGANTRGMDVLLGDVVLFSVRHEISVDFPDPSMIRKGV